MAEFTFRPGEKVFVTMGGSADGEKEIPLCKAIVFDAQVIAYHSSSHVLTSTPYLTQT